MKLLLFIFPLFMVLFFSCEKEESIVTTDFLALTQAEGADFLASKGGQPEFNLCFEIFDPVDVAGITPCATAYTLAPITATLPFSSDNPDIVDELKDKFYCHPDFSTCLGATIPQEICTIKFTLFDTKVFGVPFPVYPNFSDAMSPALSNQVMQYFACTMIDFGDTYYPDYEIAHVNFVQDQNLCNNCVGGGGIGDEELLNAFVSYYIY